MWVYIHTCIIHILCSSVYAKGLEAMTSTLIITCLSSRSLFPMSLSSKRIQGNLEKWPIPDRELEKSNMSLEELKPNGKDEPKDIWTHIRRTQELT